MRLAARLVCCALLVAACGCADPTRWPHDLTPLEQLPWPAAAPAPAGCDPWPVWALTIDPARLAELVADPHANRYVDATVTAAGVSHPARVRLHGGTSRDFVKKSFRIDLPEGDAIDGRRRLILRGEWNDKSLLRTYLAYELFRTATWLPTPRAEYVHLDLNGEFYGVMLHVERIDAEFLAARHLDRAGQLIEADPPLGGQPGNLRPMPESSYASVYEPHGDGPRDLAALRDLVERVLTLKPHAFADEAARAIVAFGFQHFALHRIAATCVAENVASARVLTKLGLRREGLLRENEHFKGRWWDTALFGMLEGEWRATGDGRHPA